MSNKKLKTYSSPKSSRSPRSPISIEDIQVEKKIETVFELIDKLNPDMKNEVFSKLMSYKPSNASNKNLLLLNNEFADTYSITRKLSKIKSESPNQIPINSLSKKIDSVVATIGDLKLKTLDKYSPVKAELTNIFSEDRIKHNNVDFFYEPHTLEGAKQTYEAITNKKDFERIKKEFEEVWDFQNSKLEMEDFFNLKDELRRYRVDFLV